MKQTPEQQRHQIAATEKHFASDAFRDSRDSMAQAHTDFKEGNFIKGAWHKQEANVDAYWGQRRLGIVNRYSR